MKKYKMFILIIVINLFFINNVYAKEINVKLKECIDGDTAIFVSNKEKIKARFLAIDTPETKYSKKGEQPYGQDASVYTCNKLKNAKKIKLEYDKNSDEKDKYDRHLVWVWIDNKLLQEDLVKNGYAKVTYLYNDYKYTNKLIDAEKSAKNNNLHIWKSNEEVISNNNEGNNNDNQDFYFSNIFIILLIFIIGIIILINKRKNNS